MGPFPPPAGGRMAGGAPASKRAFRPGVHVMLMGVGEGSPPAKRLRSMQRRWKITLTGAGTAVAAAGLSVLLVLLLPGRPAAQQRAVPVMYMGHPARMTHLRDLRPAFPAQLLSPFSGEPVKALGRVIVAKIDNIADA